MLTRVQLVGLILGVATVVVALVPGVPATASAPNLTPGSAVLGLPVVHERTATGDIGSPSCPTTTFCVAADHGGNIETWNGSAWTSYWLDRTSPTNLPGLKVSCASPTFCLAVDSTLNTFVFTNGHWSGPTADTSWTASTEMSGAWGVACASSTFCVLWGDGAASKFNGANWSRSQPTDVDDTIIDLTCPAVEECIAMEPESSLTFDGTSWSSPIPIPEPGGDYPLSMSCPAASDCYALGQWGYAIHWDGTTWSRLTPSPSGYAVESVSCSADDYCVAIASDPNGGAQYQTTLHDDAWSQPQPTDISWLYCWNRVTCLAGLAPADSTAPMATEQLINGQWQAPQDVPANFGATFQTVSCPSATFCIALDTSNRYMTFNGSTWSSFHKIRSADSLVTNELDCTSATFCVAIDNDSQALVWHGHRWHVSSHLKPATSAISCASPTFCMTLSADHDTAQTFDGHTWTKPTTVFGRGDFPYSLSCPSARFCLAADRNARVLAYREGTWTRSAPLADNEIGPVSCASPTFCVAAVSNTATLFDATVRYYDGTTWSRLQMLRGDGIQHLDCPRAGLCDATTLGGDVYQFTPRRAGTAQHADVNFNFDLYGMSCPTANACQIVTQYTTLPVSFERRS